uniref:RCK N-terminal domain-containing protein n=1 Tax=Chelonoidis abingdonii TaxID=106734 RepID=A0A8C0HHR2_CHEAB
MWLNCHHGCDVADHLLCLFRTAALVIEEDRNALLDSTGMFHWCEAVPLEQAILGQTTSPLHDHIVVCVFGDANSTLIGLRNFVMPLRASNFTYQELKDIVFVGSLEYIKREWKFIQNFPKLLLFPGSALSCADLRAVNIRYCTMCTILSSNLRASTNPTLVDTESILATLNIRSMQFKCSSTAGGKNATSNVQFIDHNISSTSHIPGRELDLTTTFSSGAVFSDSFLDSLLSTTYRNHHVLALLQTLVTGGTNPELEEQLAEKNMLSGSFNSMAYVAPRARCKLALVPLGPDPQMDSFGDIYCKALDLFGILCFGLYRLTEEPNPYRNRGLLQFELGKKDPKNICLINYNHNAAIILDGGKGDTINFGVLMKTKESQHSLITCAVIPKARESHPVIPAMSQKCWLN